MDTVDETLTQGEDDGEEPRERRRTRVSPKRIDADVILDSLMPPSIDWRETVRRYPLESVFGVGLVGYLVGRTKGAAIMAGLTMGISSALMRQLSDVFDADFFDFE
jgi:hypothetical protein